MMLSQMDGTSVLTAVLPGYMLPRVLSNLGVTSGNISALDQAKMTWGELINSSTHNVSFNLVPR